MGESQNSNSNLTVTRSPPVIIHPAGDIPAGSAATYYLSNLDQNLAVTMKTVYCYPAKDRRSTENAGEVLKTSLEKVLVHFYPFDGRLGVSDDGKLVVRINGGGVPFVEAEAECQLEELGDVASQGPENLGELIYFPTDQSIFEMPLLTIQLTRFKCGGFIVGMAMNHSLSDGISTVHFLHSWAEISRGLPISLPPFLNRSILSAQQRPTTHFPHPEFTDLAPSLSSFSSLPILQKSFTFTPQKLSRLKFLASNNIPGPPPSTFSVLTALVWRARTKSLNFPPLEPAKLLFAVDCRNRLNPPLPTGFFGNAIVFACCICQAGDLINKPLAHAVQMIQTATRDISDRYIRSVVDHYELNRVRPSLAGTLLLTDWTRLELGATDFGWGSAVQTGSAELPLREVALLLPENMGGLGTVLAIGLPELAMREFEEMMEF